MRPAMERLMHEILTQAFVGEVIKLEYLNKKLGADSSAKQERVRNATTRLCGSGHLKKHGQGYVFVKAFRSEPPTVPSLFVESASPIEKSQNDVVDNTICNQFGEKPFTRNGRVSPGPRNPGVRLWVLKTLELHDGPLSITELARLGSVHMRRWKGDYIKYTVRKLSHLGLIDRPKRGYYQAKQGVRPISMEVSNAQACEEKPRYDELNEGYAGVLKEDVAHFEALILKFKEEKATAESRAITLKRSIEELEYLVLQREKKLSDIVSKREKTHSAVATT